jgi:hypothetical protein
MRPIPDAVSADPPFEDLVRNQILSMEIMTALQVREPSLRVWQSSLQLSESEFKHLHGRVTHRVRSRGPTLYM